MESGSFGVACPERKDNVYDRDEQRGTGLSLCPILDRAEPA
jgi:hypothetical protein